MRIEIGWGNMQIDIQQTDHPARPLVRLIFNELIEARAMPHATFVKALEPHSIEHICTELRARARECKLQSLRWVRDESDAGRVTMAADQREALVALEAEA